jgi:hypothetical protein
VILNDTIATVLKKESSQVFQLRHFVIYWAIRLCQRDSCL